jgi:hypothetical protein
MGRATKRELALGLRSAEANLAATLGRSMRRWGGDAAPETQTTAASVALSALDLR